LNNLRIEFFSFATEAAVYCRGLEVVAVRAERLMIVAVPEESAVAAMRYFVIDDLGSNLSARVSIEWIGAENILG